MRRTYRSKKDTASGVERRDLFQNLDGKSAPYDAFSIQNIKQTKRELSYNASSNILGVASNRVRKKKFVKRIVKDPVTVCRESVSPSAYLTPDKSIRVNKPLDPFDLLLMSSPARPVETLVKNNVESITEKVNLFDQPVLRKEGKTYTRRKPKKIKNFNYSSSTGSSDSDKENSDHQPNITQNTSDIRTHKLLVEQEVNTTPKRSDDSINNIVNNLSLINKLKHEYNANESMNRSQRFNKHRLNKDILSPLLQKSPLCSTPFKVKYRGESIFKFSPIASTYYNLKYTTTTEDRDDGNSSVVLIGKAKIDSLRVHVPNAGTSAINLVSNVEHGASNDRVSPDKEADTYAELNVEKSHEAKKTSDVHVNTISSVEISYFQTTETEPFLGFSNNAINKMVSENDKEVIRLSHLDDSIPNTDITQIEVSENDPSLENESSITMPKNDSEIEIAEENLSVCEENNDITNENEDNNLSSQTDNDKDSLYDTCTSFVEAEEMKDSLAEEKEPMVLMERMNESSFIKYYNKMKYKYGQNYAGDSSSNSEFEHKAPGNSSDNESNNSDESPSNSSDIESNNSDKSPSNSSDIESNNSDKSPSNSSNIESNNSDKSPSNSSDIESENNSNDISFNSNNDTKISAEIGSENESDQNDVTFNSELENSNDSNKSSKNNSMISNSNFKSQLEDNDLNKFGSDSETNDNIVKNDNDDYDDNYQESNSNNEEEKCMSFVTTRRRKEVTNNSIISMFSDSYSSSSTNCDKTVLSNKQNKSDILDNNDSLADFNTFNDVDNEIIDSEHSNEDETRISFVTTRSSNITDRKSTIKARKSSIKPKNSTLTIGRSKLPRESFRMESETSNMSCLDAKPGIVLRPGKKWERSLSIYRRITMMTDQFDKSILEEPTDTKGRKYRQSVISTMEMQEYSSSLHNESLNSRRSTFVSKPIRSTIRIVKDPDCTRLSLCNTTVFEGLKGFLTEECDDTIIELSKLSIADQTHEVTVLDNFHDTSKRIATAKDYVLRRCNQSDVILFDECYPDTVLKNCHKIGEGVYGEVFLWRDRDGRARVLKIVPIAGDLKVNGESQKDYHEIISEIVIAMELSALRAPIAEIERHFDEGKDVEALDLHAIENATDIFNEVLAVRCVYGSYPSRLLDLWDLYDECKGSENDNPAILPIEQQYIVLELANAGQDLESYQFNNAEQAHALFLQVAYGLAVAEEAFQFEHRDLHWGNVLISPTEQKWATFVIRGRSVRVARRGVAAALIDYSLSRAAPAGAPLYNDLAREHDLFDAVGDYQFQVYRLMRERLGNDWKNFEPYTNILWLHYTVDKMITALRYKRTNTKIHKHYIDKLKGIKSRILDYGSAAQFVLTDNEI